MKQQLRSFLISLSLVTAILFVAQYFITVNFFKTTEFYYGVPAIYAFMVLSTLIIYLILLWIHHNFSENTGFAFMGASLLKMLAAVLFLLPMILARLEDDIENIFAFFIPYFFYLIFETIQAVRLINSK